MTRNSLLVAGLTVMPTMSAGRRPYRSWLAAAPVLPGGTRVGAGAATALKATTCPPSGKRSQNLRPEHDEPNQLPVALGVRSLHPTRKPSAPGESAGGRGFPPRCRG